MEHMETSTELGGRVKECVFFSKMKKKYTDLFLPPPGLIAPKKKHQITPEMWYMHQ